MGGCSSSCGGASALRRAPAPDGRLRIAAFVDAAGELISFFEPGFVRLYERADGRWSCVSETSLALERDHGLAHLKSQLKGAIGGLAHCGVFIGQRLRGIHNVLLEDMGFHNWEGEGPVLAKLDEVAEREAAAARAAAAAAKEACGVCPSAAAVDTAAVVIETAPVKVGDGHFRLHLTAVLNSHPELNSRQLLIPFLNAGGFDRLDIVCDHQPRWLAQELDRLQLAAVAEPLVQGRREFTISIGRRG
ncbi:Fe-only nitrogenase accessory protein AnfO [Rhodopseudomonas rhenobacensis]|uniref:Fe-only nitrogenase accessory protein AnfO n=1 Tax=Rhodopseudomonas rhenobacensis TaxID=87461 RepID=A0A7W7Z124_9BRAD|nr:Fe-only nitrogenase accessory protein AnfO [Rhodopseudomonas rhenobacensis]MBB5046031.1 Fe-only nitrogenase accessory protein AnfO [Rhodopseudomonas rhenobacensis]